MNIPIPIVTASMEPNCGLGLNNDMYIFSRDARLKYSKFTCANSQVPQHVMPTGPDTFHVFGDAENCRLGMLAGGSLTGCSGIFSIKGSEILTWQRSRGLMMSCTQVTCFCACSSCLIPLPTAHVNRMAGSHTVTNSNSSSAGGCKFAFT